MVNVYAWNYHRIFLIMLFFAHPLADFSKVYKNRHLEDFKFVWSRGIVFSDPQVHGAGENTFQCASGCGDGILFG